MPVLTINNISVEARNGESILLAAERAGIHIPRMCWLKDFEPSASCMMCVVQERKTGKVLISCSVQAEEGMDIVTDNAEIEDLRKTALELLLSEHYGDCEAPCQRACPAGMDIPEVNRLIRDGELNRAIQVIKKNIALPAILGHICPAPCEKACRSKDIDQPVSICLLKRFVAENDLFGRETYKAEMLPAREKTVAIIGAGATGLSAAYYLNLAGYGCHLYDSAGQPGGTLRAAVTEGTLPEKVLEAEIEHILSQGPVFHPHCRIEATEIKEQLATKFDYILYAGAEETGIDFTFFGTDLCPEFKELDIYSIRNCRIFVPLNKQGKNKLAVRSVALGKKAADWLIDYDQQQVLPLSKKSFNSVYRPIAVEEQAEFLKEADNHNNRINTTGNNTYSEQQARQEAARCLHCDCRKKDNCLLREHSNHYQPNARRYRLDPAPFVEKNTSHPLVIFETLKCIKCGLCLQTAQKEGDKTGLCFEGRGFNVRVAVPIQRSLESIQDSTLIECARNCPTGAIALRSSNLERPVNRELFLNSGKK